MAAVKTVSPEKVAADLLKSTTRDPAYTISAGFPIAEVSPGVKVARGVRVNGNTPSLVVIDGSRQTGLAMSAIATAIAYGTITRAEADALLALSA